MHNFRWWSVFNNIHFRMGFMLCSLAFNANAVVNAEKTRVVFNSGSQSESLSLVNSDKQPVVIQVWTDNGDPAVTPDKVQTPIVIEPPVFKMKPGEIRNLRLILLSSDSLPKDRESVFWLNIFQVPPNTVGQQAVARRLVLPLKIRMKVFVRPKGIGELKEADVNKMQFEVVGIGAEKNLIINNPTPWHITLAGLKLGKVDFSPLMVEPYSKVTLPIAAGVMLSDSILYEALNDFGTRLQGKKAL
ncbi:fimbria/pilus periplasmic chaperone [Lelliottia nimipressuralis]|uniref:fimbria/pilus periplasmic chaperone n=1 Tax=Lelliottia nimipressuralis TaxID=69220 RepID=UPI0039064637